MILGNSLEVINAYLEDNGIDASTLSGCEQEDFEYIKLLLKKIKLLS